MNELITPELSKLPSMPDEEVKQTVDKVGAYVNALAAAKKATTDQNTINEIDEQIRKYSAFKIRCQMELGERTAKMESASGKRKDLVSHQNEVTKTDEVKKLGLTRKQAWQNEQLVKPENRPIVEQYLERTEKAKEVPTTSGAMKEVLRVTAPKKDEIVRKYEQLAEATKQDGKTVDIQKAKTHKEAEAFLEEQKAFEIDRIIANIIRDCRKLTDSDFELLYRVYSERGDPAYLPYARTVWNAGQKLIQLGKWIQEVNKGK